MPGETIATINAESFDEIMRGLADDPEVRAAALAFSTTVETASSPHELPSGVLDVAPISSLPSEVRAIFCSGGGDDGDDGGGNDDGGSKCCSWGGR